MKRQKLYEPYLRYLIGLVRLYLGLFQQLLSLTLNKKVNRGETPRFKTDNVSTTTDPLKPRPKVSQPVPASSLGLRAVESSSPTYRPRHRFSVSLGQAGRSTLAYIISQRKLRGIKAWIGGLKARISGQLAPIYRRKTYSSQLFRAITILFAGCWRGAFWIGSLEWPQQPDSLFFLLLGRGGILSWIMCPFTRPRQL